MDAAVIERRRDYRYGRDAVGAMRARVRPGHEVVIVDVSPSGALIEMTIPLRPGARVHVHLKASSSEAALGARVTRCAVTAVSETRVLYRAGLQFDHDCDWVRESVTHSGYGLPESGSIGSTHAGTPLPTGDPSRVAEAPEMLK
jgi:PilZ domain-containing protein